MLEDQFQTCFAPSSSMTTYQRPHLCLGYPLQTTGRLQCQCGEACTLHRTLPRALAGGGPRCGFSEQQGGLDREVVLDLGFGFPPNRKCCKVHQVLLLSCTDCFEVKESRGRLRKVSLSLVSIEVCLISPIPSLLI